MSIVRKSYSARFKLQLVEYAGVHSNAQNLGCALYTSANIFFFRKFLIEIWGVSDNRENTVYTGRKNKCHMNGASY